MTARYLAALEPQRNHPMPTLTTQAQGRRGGGGGQRGTSNNHRSNQRRHYRGAQQPQQQQSRRRVRGSRSNRASRLTIIGVQVILPPSETGDSSYDAYLDALYDTETRLATACSDVSGDEIQFVVTGIPMFMTQVDRLFAFMQRMLTGWDEMKDAASASNSADDTRPGTPTTSAESVMENMRCTLSAMLDLLHTLTELALSCLLEHAKSLEAYVKRTSELFTESQDYRSALALKAAGVAREVDLYQLSEIQNVLALADDWMQRCRRQQEVFVDLERQWLAIRGARA